MTGYDTKTGTVQYWTVLSEHTFYSLEKVRGWQVWKFTATFQRMQM